MLKVDFCKLSKVYIQVKGNSPLHAVYLLPSLCAWDSCRCECPFTSKGLAAQFLGLLMYLLGEGGFFIEGLQMCLGPGLYLFKLFVLLCPYLRAHIF